MHTEVKEDLVKTSIIEAARTLFKKYGYNRIVMEDIAKAIHKGRTTIYIYFKNKEELFNAALQREVVDYFTELNKVLAASTSATDKLEKYLFIKFNFVQHKVNECLVLATEILQQPEMYRKVRSLFEPQERDILAQIIKDGIKGKEFRHMSEQEADLLASVFLSTLRGIIDDFCLQSQSCQIDEVQDILEKMLLKMLQ